MPANKPKSKPSSPCFSTGPCKKYPTFSLEKLNSKFLGRSHRSALAKSVLSDAVTATRKHLQLPEGYKVAIVAGSDTGAFEIAMWNLLGQRTADVFHWESFSSDWYNDIANHLQLDAINNHFAEYGQLPDLSKAKPENDIVFTYNGTTSGAKVPNLDWISADRQGLVFCDATSAVFAMNIDWQKIDVASFSWQKVLGSEAAHGMLIMSPRAIAQLNNYTVPWPLPKLFRLKASNGKVNENIFDGVTINTPSMLCVSDYLNALEWYDSIGGLSSSIKICQENYSVVADFVAKHKWINFLVQNLDYRSYTSVCLTIDAGAARIKNILKILADENAAYDINSYKTAPVGIRIWCGPTIAKADIALLLEWLEWAYEQF